jgi:benzoyl-CoA 2,3-dioxygenase component B
MLTEEAHHMFVGETGIGRVAQRACQLMKQDPNEDARAQGGIDLPMLQKYINFWYTSSVDLFGGEISSNAADYFASGLKGREREERHQDHVALAGHYALDVMENGVLESKEVPLRNAMNEVLRDAYRDDNQRGVDRWNRMIADAGIQFELKLPSKRFNRQLGIYAGHFFDPEGNPIPSEEFKRRRSEWLPTEADKAYVKSLMKPVLAPGQMAHWIAPPARGINGQPLEFQYIRRA